MPLFLQVGVANFWFNFSCLYASPFLKPYCSRSFFMYCCNNFLGRPFFLFPIISSSITSSICKLMSWGMTRPYHHRQVWIIISLITTPTLSWRTSVNTLLTSLTPHLILIIWCSIPVYLASSATVSFHFSQ